MKKHILYIIAVASLCSCTNEAPQPELTVTADRTTVAVGEPVTLSITHSLDGLTVFTGEKGHDYSKSAWCILADKSEEDIKDNVYRPVNPDVVPLIYDFRDAEPGERVIGDGTVEVINAGSGVNLVGTEAIVEDAGNGGRWLRMISTHPDWWYLALRVHTNTQVGSNTNLSLRMHFDKDYLMDIYTGEMRPDIATFGVVIRLAGHQDEGEAPIFSESSVWDIYWGPSTDSQEYTVDLSRIITAWQTSTGKEMRYLDYVQVLFTSQGTVGYIGDIYIEQIKYGDYDYQAYDTGEAINLNGGPGTVKYTHTFDRPGVYDMVVLGTTAGLKNQNGSYTTDLGDKINASEYRFKHEIRSVNITVTE